MWLILRERIRDRGVAELVKDVIIWNFYLMDSVENKPLLGLIYLIASAFVHDCADYVLKIEGHLPLWTSDHQNQLAQIKISLPRLHTLLLIFESNYTFHLTYLMSLVINFMIK